jgi:hypothetical protein
MAYAGSIPDSFAIVAEAEEGSDQRIVERPRVVIISAVAQVALAWLIENGRAVVIAAAAVKSAPAMDAATLIHMKAGAAMMNHHLIIGAMVEGARWYG